MRAMVVDALGAPPRMETSASTPRPAPGEVLVRVRACGLNFADLLMIEGKYQERQTPPFSPGMEIAGDVLAVGEGVTGVAVRDRVIAFAGSGGLAEQAVVTAKRCVPLPDAMDYVTGAAFQVAYGTSHLALTDAAALRAGETLLVLGAAGGVGLTAVEIGAQLGARVIAVARGPEKLAVAQAAGASHLIDGTDADIRVEVKALGGADVVYDPVGGQDFMAALRATRPGGRILSIGFASGEVPQIPANLLLVKNLRVIGFYWGGHLQFAPDRLTASLSHLIAWHAQGRIRPHISHVLPLERAAEGLDLLRSRRSTGKVVITL
ncbi:MAG: NADPH:quinone oxidoreductase family protein [Alkalilacustris sp.]